MPRLGGKPSRCPRRWRSEPVQDGASRRRGASLGARQRASLARRAPAPPSPTCQPARGGDLDRFPRASRSLHAQLSLLRHGKLREGAGCRRPARSCLRAGLGEAGEEGWTRRERRGLPPLWLHNPVNFVNITSSAISVL